MKKKPAVFLIMSMSMVLGSAVCHASIIPPKGPGQIGYSSVVLCNSLTAHQDPSFSSPSVQTLHYGDKIIVMSTKDGWAEAALSDDVDGVPVWVNEDFVAIDPSYYQTEGDTVVYAWNDTGAKKVALLEEGTILPILRDDGDWIVVSLRGAAGWINNPVRSGSQAAAPSGDSSGAVTPSQSGSGAVTPSQDGSGAGIPSQGGVITVFDENGDAYTLFQSTDGNWRDSSGTVYDRLTDMDFQVHEGTKRLSVSYPAQIDSLDEN